MPLFAVPTVKPTAETELGWRRQPSRPANVQTQPPPYQSDVAPRVARAPRGLHDDLPHYHVGAAAGLLPPKKWVAPPSNGWRNPTASERAAKAGLLRGAMACPDVGPDHVAAVVGALMHDNGLRNAVHEGLALLHDLQSGTPPTQMTITQDEDVASDWFAKARQAQLDASTKSVLAAMDAWVTWPGSRRVTGDVYATVAGNELAIAAACDATRHPLPLFEIPAFQRVAAGQEENDTHIRANPAAFAVALLTAAMAEVQFARRTTAALRRLIPVGRTLSEALGEDAIFSAVAGRRRGVKQCSACGLRRADYVPYLGLQLDAPADLRRRKATMAGQLRDRVLSSIPLHDAIDVSLHTTTLVRSRCDSCCRVTEHRVDEEPGPWPSRLLIVLMPDVKMDAVDCIRVNPSLELPDRAATSNGFATFVLIAAVVQHRPATAHLRTNAVAVDALEAVTYLRERLSADEKADVWWKASPSMGVAVTSEPEVIGECSIGGRFLVFERQLPDAIAARANGVESLV